MDSQSVEQELVFAADLRALARNAMTALMRWSSAATVRGIVRARESVIALSSRVAFADERSK
jgi:hypothetical protein